MDGDNNLYHSLKDTIHNLEDAADNPALTVLVLLDGAGNGDTWRYHVQSDGNYSDGVNRWSMGELNMNNPQTLSDFIRWARENYPAKHYYLAVDDHGRGTEGIAWDDTTGINEFISVDELGKALQDATLDGDEVLDVVHYNACLMGMLENAYQIRDYADYLIISENISWTLDRDYVPWAIQVTVSTTPEQLATAVVDAYYNAAIGYPRTISALDLEQAGTVEDAVTALATTLQANLDDNKYYVSNSRDATQKFDSRNYVINIDDEYLDLYDFARLIHQNHPDVNVKNAAQGVMDAVNTLVVAERHQSGYAYNCIDGDYQVHRQVYWDLDDAHGVAIYFPPASGVWDYNPYMSHVLFRFTVDGQWDEFLQAYFGAMGLPPETPVDPRRPPRLPVTYSVHLPFIIKQ